TSLYSPFYCHVPLPHLHSFPTRRSSDLSRSGPAARPAKFHSLWKSSPRCSRKRRPRRAARCLSPKARPAAFITRTRKRCCRAMRSEEHTSELQSRFDLVCRLLLEKKNQK